jgi:hypothetical protein
VNSFRMDTLFVSDDVLCANMREAIITNEYSHRLTCRFRKGLRAAMLRMVALCKRQQFECLVISYYEGVKFWKK